MKTRYFTQSPFQSLFTLGLTLLLAVGGCDSSGKGISGHLETFNGESESVIQGLEVIYDTSVATETAINQDDLETAGQLISQMGTAIDQTLWSLDRLEKAEDAIVALQNAREPSASGAHSVSRPLGILGASIIIAGLAAYCKKLKAAQKEASAAWKKTSDTLHDVGEGKATEEEYHADKNVLIEKNQKGLEIIREKVMSYGLSKLPSVGSKGTAIKLLLKKNQNKTAEAGVGVMFATKGCRILGEASDCAVGALKTDSEGKIPTFSGDLTLAASKPGMSRVVAADVQVVEGQTTEVERENLPIEDATPQKVTANDNGTYDPNDWEEETTGDNSSRPWILCYSFENLYYHYACTVYSGDAQDLYDGDYLGAMSQCASAGYARYANYFSGANGMSAEEECIDACLYYQSGGAQGDAVCDTPN